MHFQIANPTSSTFPLLDLPRQEANGAIKDKNAVLYGYRHGEILSEVQLYI
jgi:hypothetical protein